MKKVLLLVTLVIGAANLSAQVFNTGQTLKKRAISFGIEPVFYTQPNDFSLFLHGGFGLKKGIDLAIKAGFGDATYFGADIEFALGRRVSFAAGAHQYHDFGLDATLNFAIPIRRDVRLFTGLDSDIVFADDKTLFPLWIPFGVEVDLSGKMSFILEVEIGLNDPAYHILGGGLSFYF